MRLPLLLTFLLAAGAGRAAEPDAAGRVEFFEKKVRPVLVANCYACHSAQTKALGGLRVDDRNGLLTGGNNGPAIVPGKSDDSLLLKRVAHADDKLRMPPRKQLGEQELADLARWVRDGAAWPAVAVPAAVGKEAPANERLRKEHWAWQPIRPTAPPAVKDGAWPRDPIDNFVLARLEAKGLAPVADADARVLARRLAFDLTGLPPTAEQVARLERDGDATRLVDELLASPAFGERWGRHWLDVARYGESTGSSRNVPYPQAWRYRDYVLDSFNSDKPFDQFVREQVAGDLLPGATDAQRVATGFLALGVKDVNQRFKVRFVMDNVDEQIDTVTRSVLGLTVSCARCHDHKFDPIPQADYYALAGIFTSTDLCAGVRNKMGGGGLDYYDSSLLVQIGEAKDLTPEAREKIAKVEAELKQARAEWNAIRGTPEGLARGPDGRPKQRPYRLKMERLQAELLALTDVAGQGRAALGAREAKAVGDTELRIRGEAEKLGPLVPRGFPSVPAVPGSSPVNRDQSGRLELAQWLTSPRNPLTPRVLVNRAWHHLFGTGLVASVDNFGTTGDAPSHPELLDHLADRFVRDGWSIKKLVRTLVRTRTYRLGGDAPRANVETDPANRLLWRHAPRRLASEEVRDALLASAGTLDRSRPAVAPVSEFKVAELRNNGPEARKLAEQARASRHRSVYLPLLRGLTPPTLEAFDPVEQGMPTGQRDATTVAPQALFLLNDPFVRRQALAQAERLLAAPGDDAGRINAAYRAALSRPATPHEVERARSYLAAYEAAARAAQPRRAEAVGEAPRELPPAPTPAVPANPDEIDQTDAPVARDNLTVADPRTAAWASLAQALYGSAEFRYVR